MKGPTVLAAACRAALLGAFALLAHEAAAHGTTIPHDLAGVALCVDDDSLRVSFEPDTDGRTAAIVRERLERALTRTFDAGALPWERRAVCGDGRGYVEVALEVIDAAWFAPRAKEYALAVRVGWRRAEGDSVRADPPDAFDFAETELFDEARVGAPAFVFLPRYVEAGLRDLAVSWWEDREEAAPAVPGWVPWLGAALAAVTAAASAALAMRRRRRGALAATRRVRDAAYHRA